MEKATEDTSSLTSTDTTHDGLRMTRTRRPFGSTCRNRTRLPEQLWYCRHPQGQTEKENNRSTHNRLEANSQPHISIESLVVEEGGMQTTETREK